MKYDITVPAIIGIVGIGVFAIVRMLRGKRSEPQTTEIEVNTDTEVKR